jgi:hypothetical protein
MRFCTKATEDQTPWRGREVVGQKTLEKNRSAWERVYKAAGAGTMMVIFMMVTRSRYEKFAAENPWNKV